MRRHDNSGCFLIGLVICVIIAILGITLLAVKGVKTWVDKEPKEFFITIGVLGIICYLLYLGNKNEK